MKKEEEMGLPEDPEYQEPSEESGLYGKLQSEEKKATKKYKHISRKELRNIVYGYFNEGYLKKPRHIWKKLKGKYKVDGEKIELGDILALKKTYQDEEPEVFEKEETVPAYTTPTDKEKEMLWQLYDDAKKKGDEKLMQRIQDRILGREPKEKTWEERLLETALRNLEGGGRNSLDEFQMKMQQSMLNFMDFQNKAMEQIAKSRGSGLSGDPNVALAQVVTPTLEKGFEEINQTVREVGGLKPKKKLTPEDEQKVQAAQKVLEQFDKINKQFIRCSECGYVIPRIAAQCPRCGSIFEPSDEERALAEAEQKKKGKPSVEPLTPVELEKIARGEQVRKNAQKVEIDMSKPKSKFPEGMEWLEGYFNPEDGTLYRLKYKIECGHDAKMSISGVWSWLDPAKDEPKKLLFAATKGIDYLLEAAKPYIDQFEQKELYEFFNTPEAKAWMITAFNQVKELAKADNIVLTEDDIKKFEDKIKPYLKNMGLCGLCGASLPFSELDAHFKECQKEQLRKIENEVKKASKG